jgi:hypothetical protein
MNREQMIDEAVRRVVRWDLGSSCPARAVGKPCDSCVRNGVIGCPAPSMGDRIRAEYRRIAAN